MSWQHTPIKKYSIQSEGETIDLDSGGGLYEKTIIYFEGGGSATMSWQLKGEDDIYTTMTRRDVKGGDDVIIEAPAGVLSFSGVGGELEARVAHLFRG